MLLERLRSDRRKLIEFIMSSNVIKAVDFPTGTAGVENVDLDVISADYVLECAKNGKVLDLSEAARMCYNEMNLPIMIDCESGCSFFLVTKPELSCSPPCRVPPELEVHMDTGAFPCSSNSLGDYVDTSRSSYDGCGIAQTTLPVQTCEILGDNNLPSIDLPSLLTDLSEDDLRDAAYETLVACLVHSGHLRRLSSTSVNLVQTTESKIKERKTRFLSRQRKKENEETTLQTQSAPAHTEVIDVICSQMEIPQEIDRCARQGLSHSSLIAEAGKLNVPKISVELLKNVSQSEFSNKKAYIRWIKRQTKILEEVLCSHSLSGVEDELTSVLAAMRNEKVWAVDNASSQVAGISIALQRSVMEFLETHEEFGTTGGSCCWEMGYHVNLRLYEKLLCSTFDSLDGQLVEETKEILGLLKATWPALGVTKTIHTALYCWVLFQQFASTGEMAILELALVELKKVQTYICDNIEAPYLSSLKCTTHSCGSQSTVDLLSAIILSIGTWCDFQLSDYHRHFYKSPSNFEKVVTSSIIINRLLNSGIDKMEGSGETKKLKESASEKVKMYITLSAKAAFEQAVNGMEARSNPEGIHPLALLADDLRSIAGRECKMFSPVLSCWYLEAKEKFALLVHEFYGEKLRPFLEGLSQLSSDTRSLLSSAYLLENDLAQYNGENLLTGPFVKEWHPYEVARTAYPLIQDWVDVQSHNNLEWTERAFHLEVWEPVSSLQKHGSSIVEVFRIIEETLDQFFSLRLPVDLKHTRCLLFGITRCLEGYIEKLRAQLVDKSNLYPAMPALTRYDDGTVNPFIKKKFVECKILDENVLMQLNDLTVFKLCVQANTLHYVENQVRALEDTIQNHWVGVRTCDCDGTTSDKGVLSHDELIQELLVPFDRVKKIANDATNQICDFVGAKVVFWDLRELFLFNLYRGNVENARMETVLERLDTVLDNVCGLINDPLRDVIVHYIFRSSLDGYIWLLLDGGPSRVFTGNDVSMLQEDLHLLKELFIADGEGLPRALVEKEALIAQEILDVYTLQTETVVERLMAASEQISTELGPVKPSNRSAESADTLLRVLCHRGDKSASNFLKMQYNLPKSSDYEESSSLRRPVLSDIFTRSTSIQWTKKGQMGIGTVKKKLQKVKSELKYGGG